MKSEKLKNMISHLPDDPRKQKAEKSIKILNLPAVSEDALAIGYMSIFLVLLFYVMSGGIVYKILFFATNSDIAAFLSSVLIALFLPTIIAVAISWFLTKKAKNKARKELSYIIGCNLENI